MRVYHLNCISACPLGGRLVDGGSAGWLDHAHLVCHCLLVETGRELVLVDTGYGLQDVARPRQRLGRVLRALLNPALRPEMTAIRQIERLGFDPRDVRHIVLTHLDFDHAGGLDDFPWARVHLLATERDEALARRSWLDRQRYRPQQWAERANWELYSPHGGEDWFGFERARPLLGLPPEIALVPLGGHTRGHAGVAVDLGNRWLLQAGDAYFFHGEMDAARPWCPPGLCLYQWLMDQDRPARRRNQARLRALRHGHAGEVELFCSHDRVEFERLARVAAETPEGVVPHNVPSGLLPVEARARHA